MCTTGGSRHSEKSSCKLPEREGPASFLESILKSRNLSDFVQSLNIIRQVTRSTDELLNELEARKRELALEREKLNLREQELERSSWQNCRKP